MKVSVVIPSYARPESLRRLLTELSAQVVDETMEVLIIDDGSPEPLEAVVLALAASSPFSMRVERVVHGGVIAARNAGARLARGEYMLSIDDDMSIDPRFVQAHIDAHRQVGRGAMSALYSDRTSLRPAALGRWYEQRAVTWKEALGPQLHAVGTGIYRVAGHLLSAGNLSLRREDYLRVGGYDEGYVIPGCEDMDLGLRLERLGVPTYRIETTHPLHLEPRLSLRAICHRQRRGAMATVRLVRRFPSVFGTPQIEQVNGPLRLGQEPLALSVKKAVKSLVGAALAEPVVLGIAAVLGRLPLRPAFHAALYDGIVGAHIQRGWRDGLKKWGGVAPYGVETRA
jgi:GT2 family glycosyltransferase